MTSLRPSRWFSKLPQLPKSGHQRRIHIDILGHSAILGTGTRSNELPTERALRLL